MPRAECSNIRRQRDRKTTLADAWHWLLFDKDSSNRKDSNQNFAQTANPNTVLNTPLVPFWNLMTVANSPEKVYQEKWTRARILLPNSPDTTDHFIDGIPVKKKYDEKMPRLQTKKFSVAYRPALLMRCCTGDRKLSEVCGDVSDAEVIASKTDLSKLSEIPGTDHRARKQKDGNQQGTGENTGEIDEVKRGLPNGQHHKRMNANDITNSRTAPGKAGKTVGKAGGQVAERQRNSECWKGSCWVENRHRQALDEKVADKQRAFNSTGDIYRLKADIENRESVIQHSETEVKTIEEKMEKLRQKWYEKNQKEFEFEYEETCPTCGQPLPAERIEEAREKAMAEFNREKAERLENISAEGRNLKELKTILEEKIEQARQGLETSGMNFLVLSKRADQSRSDAILDGQSRSRIL